MTDHDYPEITNCTICGRPLVNPSSVVAGIGPTCREKAGIPSDMSEADRSALACLGSEFFRAARRDRPAVVAKIEASAIGAKWPTYPAYLRDMLRPKGGHVVTVDRETVTVGYRSSERQVDGFVLRTPYTAEDGGDTSKAFNAAFKAAVPSRDRGITLKPDPKGGRDRFDGWTVAGTDHYRFTVGRLLREHFGGMADISADGGEAKPLTPLPAESKATSMAAERRQARYREFLSR